jgi:hypothetical protein
MSALLSGCVAVLDRAFAMGGRAVVSLAVVPNCTFAKDKCAAGQILARGEAVIKYKSPLNVLKGTYDYSCY